MNSIGCSLLFVTGISPSQHCQKLSIASGYNSAWCRIGFRIIFHDLETEFLIRLQGQWYIDKEVNYA